MAGVAFRGLTKQFADPQSGKMTTAVNNLNLDVRDGEFLVLVGPSGCGKTTALRMLAGLEEATEGDILIGERRVNDVPPRERDIAMVFQNYALYPHMSVYDNMAFGVRLRRLGNFWWQMTHREEAAQIKSDIDTRIQEAAAQLDLKHLLGRKPSQLSGGQRQRVALGRAVVREPQVFLMDEPLSNLDAKLRVQTRAELIKLHRSLGVTTVYVTHDQVEAMTMGQRIAVMKDGLLQQCDTPLNLYHQPANAFVAGFLGTPSMNLVPAKLSGGEGKAVLDCGGFSIPWPRAVPSKYFGHEVIFGIRPEDLYPLSAAPTNLQTQPPVTLTFDVIEPMGATSTVFLLAGETPLTAVIDGQAPAHENEKMPFVFDLDRAHIFDRETELAIR